jgi:hypothetical protein
MSTQAESLWVRKPIRDKMHENGWFTKIVHCDQNQKGIPDLIACHRIHGFRLIEFKIIRSNKISFTIDQLLDFPKFIINGTHIWFLCTKFDLRRDDQTYNLQRLYNKILLQSNDKFFMSKQYELLF